MTRPIRALLGTALACVTAVAASGCEDFLAVDDPTVIDVATVDPVADATTLAFSAQQNFAVAYGWMIMYSSWFVGEALVAETFPTRNEFGRRDVAEDNGSHNADVWQPLSVATASTDLVLQLSLPTPESNLNIARAALYRGFSFVMMAEHFCTGTVSTAGEPGPELTTAAMLDSAIVHFTTANSVGTAQASAAGLAIARAALVGRARAQLQAGRLTQAATDAAAVPAAFNFTLSYIDDLAQRTRLGNRMWQFTLDRGSITVAPAFRVTDPRVPYKAPGQHSLTPQDPSSGPFYIQNKYPTFATSIRLASKIEADYIQAEAQGTAAQLTLIAARRAANSQEAYSGATDATSVLTELMEQRGREFYLEGKRLGDFRRNPNNVLNVPVAGSTYFKPGFAPVGSQTCYPLPTAERDNNPNL